MAVRLGDSDFPVSAGSGGQFGANNSTSGVYAACMKLRDAVAQKLGFNSADVAFADGMVTSRRAEPAPCASGVRRRSLAEDAIEYGDLDKRYQESTFAAHFVEVAVDSATGEIRVRRMLAVCACRPDSQSRRPRAARLSAR